MSAIVTVFDPLQFLVPFTGRVKVILQDIWMASQLEAKWQQWIRELPELSRFTIFRLLLRNPKQTHLHVFWRLGKQICICRLSRVSYHTVSTSTTCLIAAKTHISHTKAITIPRLELMGLGSVISARLTKHILQGSPITKTIFWTDSTNGLYQIRYQSLIFKKFTVNRVGEIKKLLDQNSGLIFREISTLLTDLQEDSLPYN